MPKAKQPRRLHKMQVDEVSLVDEGANNRRYLIHKARATDALSKLQSQPPEVQERIDAVVESLAKVRFLPPTAAPAPAPAARAAAPRPPSPPAVDRAPAPEMDRGAVNALKAVGRILQPYPQIKLAQISAVLAANQQGLEPDDPNETDTESADEEEALDEYDDYGAEEESIDYEPENDDTLPEPDAEPAPGAADNSAQQDQVTMPKPNAVEPKDHSAALMAANAAYQKALTDKGYKITKAAAEPEEKDDGDDESQPVKKNAHLHFTEDQLAIIKAAMAEETRELVEKARQAADRVKELEAQVQAEADDRMTRESITKAKNYDHLGASTDELAQLLKSANATSPELCQKFETILKAANAQLKNSGLFGERGSRLSPERQSADDEFQNAKQEYIQKNAASGKSQQQLLVEFLKTDQAKSNLAAAYRKEGLI